MKRLSPIRRRVSTRSVPLRTSVPCRGTDLLFQLFHHTLHDPLSQAASFPAHTVTCRALQHSLGTARRRSFPPLNLHRARVRRNRGRLPSSRCIESARTHRARAGALPLRASDTTLRLFLARVAVSPASVASAVPGLACSFRVRLHSGTIVKVLRVATSN